MPQDTDLQQIRSIHANQRKILAHARKLKAQYYETLKRGNQTEANNIFSELTKLIKDLDTIKTQFEAFYQMHMKRKTQVEHKRKRQQIVN